MKTFCNSVPKYFSAYIIVIVFVITSAAPLYAENSPAENSSDEESRAENSPDENSPSENSCTENSCTENSPAEEKSTVIEESINKFFTKFGINSIGLLTGVVITDEFDAGFGFGAKIPRQIFSPSIELTSSVYFWGASKDSLDVSSIGIEESLTLKKSFKKKFSVFAGITLGYYFITEKFDTIERNSLKTIEHDNNTFESYVVAGIKFFSKSNRSFFTQIKYGLTQDSKELHVLAGISFHINQ